jgi:hypothetical protein
LFLCAGVTSASSINVHIIPPNAVTVDVPHRYHLRLQLAVGIHCKADSVKFKPRTGKLTVNCRVLTAAEAATVEAAAEAAAEVRGLQQAIAANEKEQQRLRQAIAASEQELQQQQQSPSLPAVAEVQRLRQAIAAIEVEQQQLPQPLVRQAIAAVGEERQRLMRAIAASEEQRQHIRQRLLELQCQRRRRGAVAICCVSVALGVIMWYRWAMGH